MNEIELMMRELQQVTGKYVSIDIDLHPRISGTPAISYKIYLEDIGWSDNLRSFEELEEWFKEYLRKREIRFRNFGYGGAK